MVTLVWPTESKTSARKSMTPTSICVFSPEWWARKKTQSSAMTRGIGPWSLRYAPSNVSPVWQLTRRSRRSAIGGRASGRAIDGHAAANPVIKDRNSRRSMAFAVLVQSPENVIAGITGDSVNGRSAGCPGRAGHDEEKGQRIEGADLPSVKLKISSAVDRCSRVRFPDESAHPHGGAVRPESRGLFAEYSDRGF